MMRVECPRCALHPVLSKTAKWIATGTSNTKRGLRRAGLQCVQCGYLWNSGLPAAIEAMEVVRRERGDEPIEIPPPPPPVPIPAPTLFGAAVGRTSQPMASAGEIARSVIADYKRRQGSDT